MSSVERNLNMDIHVNSLLAAMFSHPSEVLVNRILSPMEKRCVLAAWASDAFAVRDNPWLRELPGSANPVPVKDMSASSSSRSNAEAEPRARQAPFTAT